MFGRDALYNITKWVKETTMKWALDSVKII